MESCRGGVLTDYGRLPPGQRNILRLIFGESPRPLRKELRSVRRMSSRRPLKGLDPSGAMAASDLTLRVPRNDAPEERPTPTVRPLRLSAFVQISRNMHETIEPCF
jgi:hypothetical protein